MSVSVPCGDALLVIRLYSSLIRFLEDEDDLDILDEVFVYVDMFCSLSLSLCYTYCLRCFFFLRILMYTMMMQCNIVCSCLVYDMI